MEQPLDSNADATDETSAQPSLQDHLALIRWTRQRRWKTTSLVVELARRLVAAVAEEHRQGRMLLRFVAEDVLHERAGRRYVISPEVARHPLDAPPRLSLLDNGIYAPEVTRQITRPLSPRTDVYALGALLYALISGEPPGVDLSKLGEKLPPLRIFEPDLPPGLDPLVRRALSRTPEGRFQDAAEMELALQQVLALQARRRAASADAPLTVKLGVSTNTGIRKSEKNPINQDLFFSAYDAELALGLVVVADGVSNCDVGSGEKAAECVVEAANELWLQLLADPDCQHPPSWRDDARFQAQLTAMLARANEAVCRKVLQLVPAGLTIETRIMSSTATALLINGRRALLANLGDSRAYLVRPELIDQLTVDLNRRTTLLRRGDGMEVVMNTSGLSQLTGNVGRFTLADGQLVPATLLPEVGGIDLLPGDRLLVCSDGVPDCIGADAESKIHRIVCNSPRPSQAAWELVVAANQMGGEDNITAIVVDCTGKEEETCPAS